MNAVVALGKRLDKHFETTKEIATDIRVGSLALAELKKEPPYDKTYRDGSRHVVQYRIKPFQTVQVVFDAGLPADGIEVA